MVRFFWRHGTPAGNAAAPPSLTSGIELPQGRPSRPFHSRMHVPALDGVRGIAILLVFLYHSFAYGGMRPTVGLDIVLYELSGGGWSGVDLFFVLSGFLITGILYDAKGEDRYFRNFYARRVLRIFPLYYGFLFLIFVVLPWLAPHAERFTSPANNQIWFWTYLVNVVVALRGWRTVGDVPHIWSLAIEEQFYVVWPLVVFLLSRRTLVLACLGMVAGSLALRLALLTTGLHLAAYVLTPARMDALALGGFLTLIAREPGGLSRLARWARPAAVSSLIFLGMITPWTSGFSVRNPVTQTIGFTLLAILYGSILAIAVASPPDTIAGRFFAHRFLRFLGRYSYGLYVFHVPIIIYIGRLFNVGSIPRFAGSQLPGQLVFTVVTALLTMAAALLSWHLFEAQFLKLKALFPYESKRRRDADRATSP